MQVPTVSFSAFAYLFSELIQYTIDRAQSTSELEDRYGVLQHTPALYGPWC